MNLVHLWIKMWNKLVIKLFESVLGFGILFFLCINIYLLGKPGTGKSSFINEVFQEKKALENFGENQTDEIKEFSFISNKYLYNEINYILQWQI